MIERTELAPGYDISRIIHGGWQFSAGHRIDGTALDGAVDVLLESAELGVTTFDCADIYTGVEELYGRFLQKWNTTSAWQPIQIHTKLVPDWSELERVDRSYVRGIVERSLSRLGVERLDLVQYYWWRDDVPGLEQTGLWLDELRVEGKIRHIAATNLDADRWQRVVRAGVPLVANQVQYSLLDRRPEARLVDELMTSDARILAFGTLAGGFLTDRWFGSEDPGSYASRSHTKYRLIIDEFGGWEPYQRLLEALARIADDVDADIPAVAARFVLDQRAVAAVITGATRPGQMRRNATATRLELSPEHHELLRRSVAGAPGPAGVVFGLERDRNGPHGRIMKVDLNADDG
ncbi:MAG: aldo/keto reductase [Gemmatimonadota bacterium]